MKIQAEEFNWHLVQDTLILLVNRVNAIRSRSKQKKRQHEHEIRIFLCKRSSALSAATSDSRNDKGNNILINSYNYKNQNGGDIETTSGASTQENREGENLLMMSGESTKWNDGAAFSGRKSES